MSLDLNVVWDTKDVRSVWSMIYISSPQCLSCWRRATCGFVGWSNLRYRLSEMVVSDLTRWYYSGLCRDFSRSCYRFFRMGLSNPNQRHNSWAWNIMLYAYSCMLLFFCVWDPCDFFPVCSVTVLGFLWSVISGLDRVHSLSLLNRFVRDLICSKGFCRVATDIAAFKRLCEKLCFVLPDYEV